MKKKLQVFVSSTYTDLLSERQAAVSAILKAGHIPAGMELFTAGNKSQMEIIKRWIDESDIYMLILGGRYGSVEKETGKSYTELEYDYAFEKGKPVFSVVITDEALDAKNKDIGKAVLELENPQKLKEFRSKVLNKISSFFSDDKDIKLCVHESLSDFAKNDELKGWISASEVDDTAALYDEIRALRDENAKLKSDMEKREPARSVKGDQSQDFEEIAEVLDKIEINVPAKASGGKEGFTTSALNLLVSMKTALVIGITSRVAASDGERFLYQELCPHLQIHGIMEPEKVPSAQYRRIVFTRKGLDFVSYIDRKVVGKKR